MYAVDYRMHPEQVQCYVLGLYSTLFLILAISLLFRKRRRLRALSSNSPCLEYLKMRLECARIFETRQDSSSPTRFAELTLQIR